MVNLNFLIIHKISIILDALINQQNQILNLNVMVIFKKYINIK